MKRTLILIIQLFSFNSVSGTYEEKFPHYFEYCTASQLKYQEAYFEGSSGGKGGHGFVYLHGLCKDSSKDYPQVENCRPSHDHKGVGISLDSDYKNIPWIAVPGRDLFLFGEVNRERPIRESEIDSVVEKASALKIFQNVDFHKEFVSRHPINSSEHQRASTIASLGTDIAINWARDLRCIKIPVTEKAVKNAAAFLNDFSNSYYTQEKDYEWSMLYNNCTHLSMNIGHALGLNRFMKYDQGLLSQLNNLAVPANAYLHYVDLALKNDNQKLKKILSKKISKNTLKEFGYIPKQPGVLINYYPAYNSSVIFKTDSLRSISILPRRSIRNIFATLKKYDIYFGEERYTNLEANLDFWRKKYSSYKASSEESAELKSYIQKQERMMNF